LIEKWNNANAIAFIKTPLISADFTAQKCPKKLTLLGV
jgi:hypothetical protein